MVDNHTGSVSMGIQDALVFLGCTPPPAAYVSFDMVVASRMTGGDLEQLPSSLGQLRLL